MAIEPLPIGSFIPNKAGLPENLAEELKPAVQKVAAADSQDESTQSSDTPAGGGSDAGRGEKLNVKA